MKRAIIEGIILAIALLAWAGVSAHAGTYAQFRTVYGDIEVELYDQDKPVTVQNFIRYVKNGSYVNSFFHRCPLNAYGYSDFVLQGGAFYIPDRVYKPFTYDNILTFPPIKDEVSQGRFFSNIYGTISMAKTTNPNSASSSFFFNLGDNSFLNTNSYGGFTVFGHTVRGTNVLNQFIGRSIDDGIIYGNAQLPELPIVGTVPSFDFVYVDITLLNVQVSRTNNHALISWNSITNVLNHVEYTTNFPPIWHDLTTTNGTGSRMQAIDSSTPTTPRFYRVRADY